jgi:hypothetical protein
MVRHMSEVQVARYKEHAVADMRMNKRTYIRCSCQTCKLGSLIDPDSADLESHLLTRGVMPAMILKMTRTLTMVVLKMRAYMMIITKEMVAADMMMIITKVMAAANMMMIITKETLPEQMVVEKTRCRRAHKHE